MFTLKCTEPGCNREFTNSVETQARRSLAFHKSTMHGIRGEFSRLKQGKPHLRDSYTCKTCGEKFKSLNLLGIHARITHKEERDKAISAAQKLEAKREYQRAYRQAHKHSNDALSPSEQLHRQALQKTAWWQVESGNPEPIKLDRCPCCGAAFFMTKGS